MKRLKILNRTVQFKGVRCEYCDANVFSLLSNGKFMCNNCKETIEIPKGAQIKQDKPTFAVSEVIEETEEELQKIDYWHEVCKIQREQTEKGIKKYGDILENNPTNLDIFERLRYLEEELIDGLMYIEHIKTKLMEDKADE